MDIEKVFIIKPLITFNNNNNNNNIYTNNLVIRNKYINSFIFNIGAISYIIANKSFFIKLNYYNKLII